MRNSWLDFRMEYGKETRSRYVNDNLWCVVAGHDERGYAVALQKCADEKQPMVRVGCRYMTLDNASKHWKSACRNRSPTLRATARRMLALIDIAVATAKYKGWLDNNVKFNPTPRKVRR